MKRTINHAAVETLMARVTEVEALVGRNDSPVDRVMEDLSKLPKDTLGANDWDTLDEAHYAAHKLAQAVRELLTVQVTEVEISAVHEKEGAA